MLSFISWSQYISFLVCITILYYLGVWFIVFKAKIPRLAFKSHHSDGDLNDLRATDEAISASQHVMDELRPVFARGTSKPQLLADIRQTIQKFQEWDDAGFRMIISDFVVQEAQSKCSIRLSEDDQRALWK